MVKKFVKLVFDSSRQLELNRFGSVFLLTEFNLKEKIKLCFLLLPEVVIGDFQQFKRPINSILLNQCAT